MAYVEEPGSPFALDDYARILIHIHRLDPPPGPGGSTIFPLVLAAGGVDLPISCRVVGLWPSQQIVAHRDAPIAGLRVHIPVQTNPDCWSFHEGVWQHLEVGKGYRMDPTGWHGAVNWGSEIRWHLITDVEGATP